MFTWLHRAVLAAEVKMINLGSVALRSAFSFEQVRMFREVPVYAPADERTEELVFQDAYAFAMGEAIYVQKKSYARDIPLMVHELEHVQQLRRWGALYPLLYHYLDLTVGYDENFFEKEATSAERRAERRAARRSSCPG